MVPKTTVTNKFQVIVFGSILASSVLTTISMF